MIYNDLTYMNREKEYPYDQKCVFLGGGTGQLTALRGCVQLNTPSKLTAVAATWDSGGKSGDLRVDEGILPPGDYLQCLLGLMEDDEQFREAIILLRDRTEGTPIGHLLASKAEKSHHGVGLGIDGLRKLFRIKGLVLPVSLNDTDLHSETTQGIQFKREHDLDKLEEDKDFSVLDAVARIFLVPQVEINPQVLTSINEADKIIFPPGSPYGSIFPHLLVGKMSEAILQSNAKLMLVLNLMTTQGQDHHLAQASRWLSVFQYYLGDDEWIKQTGKSRINYLIVNENHIDPEVLAIYENKGQKIVEVDQKKCEEIAPDMQIIKTNLVDYNRRVHLLRHEPLRLAQTILSL